MIEENKKEEQVLSILYKDPYLSLISSNKSRRLLLKTQGDDYYWLGMRALKEFNRCISQWIEEKEKEL